MAESAPLTEHLIAAFRTQEEAEDALRLLQDVGHDAEHLSIMGNSCVTESRSIGFVKTDGQVRPLGDLGMSWNSTWGLLSGSAVIIVPGLGFVCFGGWLVAPVEKAAAGAGADVIESILADVGIPRRRAAQYKEAVKAGRSLVIAHGRESEMSRAQFTLSKTLATCVECFSTKPASKLGGLLPAISLL